MMVMGVGGGGGCEGLVWFFLFVYIDVDGGLGDEERIGVFDCGLLWLEWCVGCEYIFGGDLVMFIEILGDLDGE